MQSAKAQESARVQPHTSSFENPEITAMAAICKILQELPDDNARLRVMRWSFGRFNPEFIRPTSQPEATSEAAPRVPHEPEAADDPTALDVRTVLAVAPDLNVDKSVDHADFAAQISELHDLFPARPKADAPIDWTAALPR